MQQRNEQLFPILLYLHEWMCGTVSFPAHGSTSVLNTQLLTYLCSLSVCPAPVAFHKHHWTYLCTTGESWYSYCQIHKHQNSALLRRIYRSVLSSVYKIQGFSFNCNFKCSSFPIKCSATQLTSSEMNNYVWKPSLNLHYTGTTWQSKG